MPLTDALCKSAKPKDKPYKLTDGQGLYLQVMPNGSRYWRFKYRYAGKEKRLALGVYPDVTLAVAREKRLEARRQIDANQDPSFLKKEEKRQVLINSANTFEAVALNWYEHYKDAWVQRHAENIISRLKRDAFPEIGSTPLASITPQLILAMIRKIEERKAFDIAKRTLQMCGQVFTYATGLGLVQQNPCYNLHKLLKPYKKGHFAALDLRELPDFLKALKSNEARLHMPTRYATELLMLTLVRTCELIGAKWSEFDFDNAEWQIPAERMKMRKAHIVPLSRQAVEIIRNQRELSDFTDWLFPNQAYPKKHMSNATILGAIKRMGYKDKMTGHGFRAMGMTAIKEKLGYRHEVIDRQLAHAHRNKVDAAYDRAQFLDERAVMMQDWADYLDQVAAGGKIIKVDFRKPPDNENAA